MSGTRTIASNGTYLVAMFNSGDGLLGIIDIIEKGSSVNKIITNGHCWYVSYMDRWLKP